MRFVPSSCLKPGMIIGKDLFGVNNELLLSAGQPLTKLEIIRINLLKYQGVFINDNISYSIEIDNIVDMNLKNKSVKMIKDLFFKSQTGELTQDHVYELNCMVKDVVNDIIANDKVIINMIDLKVFDDYTYYHSVSVLILSVIIGVSLGFSNQKLYNLGMGAILHDLGKVYIPKYVLNKNGKLTEDEYDMIKMHPETGSELLKQSWALSTESNMAVLTHHEKYDGTGYPFNLAGDKIPEFGRVVAVADVYDALTSDRPYRKAMLPSNAMEFIMGGSGTHFDPEVVKIFTQKIMPFPVGTCVSLSNGLKGIVIENYAENCLRPKIRILSEENKDAIFDLCSDRDLLNVTIVDIANI